MDYLVIKNGQFDFFQSVGADYRNQQGVPRGQNVNIFLTPLRPIIYVLD
jgi:hypothetical protein